MRTTTEHPLAVLRERLAERRAGGVRFSLAWMEARVEALMLINQEHRDAWREVFAETRDGWERAYQREAQTGPEAALAEVADAGFLGGVPDASEAEAAPEPRICRECARPIPDAVKPTARFCSPRCKRAFNYRREQARAEAARRSTRPSAAVRTLSDGSRPTGGTLIATTAIERTAA